MSTNQKHEPSGKRRLSNRNHGLWITTAISAVTIYCGSGTFELRANNGNSALNQLTAPVAPADLPIAPLREKPTIANTAGIIIDKLAAQQLGKAFFWDAQVGSAGQACASCHYHAGADVRVTNQINPQGSQFSAVPGPDAQLGPGDYPFHLLANITDRDSAILSDSNDVTGSQGTFEGTFIPNTSTAAVLSAAAPSAAQIASGTAPPVAPDQCTYSIDPTDPFNNGTTLLYRRVTGRNTPSNINAAFNYRQFWDGRANNTFNGVDPFGRRTNLANPAAGILVSASPDGVPTLRKIEISNASLASQAVGPALSPVEMSCAGRTFADLGRRLINAGALAGQRVHPEDSLFSQTLGLINTSGAGLGTTYADMIRRAFNPFYWRNTARTTITSTGVVQVDPDGYTQMEHNFSFFWGLAIQEYEALLISDRSRFDLGLLNQSERKGMDIFNSGKAKCFNCHSGPLFSAATMTEADPGNPERVERMIMGDGTPALYDHGFYNIGVRPTFEDRGIGGVDGTALGFDLSFARQYKWQMLGRHDRVADNFLVNPCLFATSFNSRNCSGQPALRGSTPATAPRDSVDGAFKVPILRNIGLTPPYFHNGGQATLHDVVNFYNRGGDRRGAPNADTSGYPLSDQAIAVLLNGANVPANLVQPPNSFGQTNPTNLDANIGNDSGGEVKNANAGLTLVGITPGGSGRGGRGGNGGSGGNGGQIANTATLTQTGGGGGGGPKGLGLSPRDVDDVVNFLLSLTDNRVACHADVFDHPELVLFFGQNPVPAAPGSIKSADTKVLLPAVGRRGLATCFPNTGELFGELQDVFMSIVTPVP
ncbi:MAG TPA: cytochrome c peroxidase [Xanthobacteraceae bacterium]|nr:cytochrome c peroxidase [Xanthobacteraceae bacterium]